MDMTRMFMAGRVTKDRVSMGRKVLIRYLFSPELGIDTEYLARLFNLSEVQIRRVLREIKEESKVDA